MWDNNYETDIEILDDCYGMIEPYDDMLDRRLREAWEDEHFSRCEED